MSTSFTRTSQAVVPGRPQFRVGPFTCVWRPRALCVSLLLLTSIAVLGTFSIGLGEFPISAPRVLEVIFTDHGSRIERLVVWEWRMPRTVTAIAVGCALGLSGALTQSVTRNALASPDILGFTAGASAAAVTVITLGSGATGFLAWLSGIGIPLAALFGAIITAAVMWMLTWKHATDSFRLVLFGLIISAILTSYMNFLMIRADLRDASTAQLWLTGSLASAQWSKTWPVVVAVLLLAPPLAWISHQLLVTVLGPNLSRALGQNIRGVQIALLGTAVALAAIAVSVAGPIGFVAFVAPQLALRLCDSSAPPLLASALTGATLLLLADMATQSLLPVELPVGILTSAIGGAFLIYLLIQRNRKNSIQ